MKTRLHSSRISTARELTVSPSMLWGGGLHGPGGGRGGIPACIEADPPPVNRMTDRCRNITLAQTSFAGGNNGIVHSRKNLIKLTIISWQIHYLSLQCKVPMHLHKPLKWQQTTDKASRIGVQTLRLQSSKHPSNVHTKLRQIIFRHR